MKKKPLSIKIISIAYILAPIANIFLTAWINHWPLSGPRGVLLHFSSLDWAILAGFPIVGFGIYRVSRIGNIVFLIFSALLITHNSYNYLHNPIYSLYVVLLFNMATLGMVGFFLQKHIWGAYYNPSLRWWEHPYRYKTHLRAVIHVRQITVDAKLLDVSTGGCFIETRSVFRLGEQLELSLSFDQVKTSIRAQVVWVKKNGQRGYGLMFTGLSRSQKSEIKDLIAAIKIYPMDIPSSSGVKTA